MFVLAAAMVHNATSAVSGAATGIAAGAAQTVETLAGGAGVRGAVDGVTTLPGSVPAPLGIVPLANATMPLANATVPLANATEPLASVAAPLAQAAATTSTTLGEASFSWGGYFQAIGVLFLLLAFLWAGLWFIRKYGKFNFIPRPGSLPRNALRLEAQLPLGPRKGLMVVRFLNRRLLLGVTDHQITLLTESDEHHDTTNILEFKDILDEAQRQKTDA